MPDVFPPGLETLSQSPYREEIRFSDYLDNARLPYISRDDYIKRYPGSSQLTGESEIVARLISSERCGGVMIYGDAGIGKTRLMLEIGLMAEKKGWIVYKITPGLKDLSQLRECLAPGSNYLLLFDSIGDHPLFTPDIIEKLEQIAPGARIKAAGNCRNIYSFASTFPQSKEFLTVELTLKGKEEEVTFNDYVVEKILGGCESLKDVQISSEYYLMRPAFAVFFRFLDEKYRKKECEVAVKNL